MVLYRPQRGSLAGAEGFCHFETFEDFIKFQLPYSDA